MQQDVGSIECSDCRVSRPGVLVRYRGFLLSKETIIAAANGLLLVAGFLVSVSGGADVGRWLYLASALIGGMPLFILAARNVFLLHDITSGVMAAVAMIAAILVGEFSAAALVVFMFAIGDWLENLTIARADNALRDLARLVPDTVTVRRGGRELAIPLSQVTAGDTVLVRSGERIAVDGRVLGGTGSVNQSAITGESMPVEKQEGDEVFAGTLNEVGAMEIGVTRLGEETTLGQIIRLVKEARATQAPVERVANRYARILVPVTFGIAILVYLLTGDIIRSITVLVVVCPCALVLATPTAVVAAVGNAARRGMLVKNGAVMERVGRVDVIAFDKTGTLTCGQPVVKDVVALNGLPSDRILALAAATERYSEHPIGRSIVQAAVGRKLRIAEPSDFAALPGFGVAAQVEERRVTIGNRALLAEQGIAWTDDIDQRTRDLELRGQTVVPVAFGSEVAGLIALADSPRPEAREAIVQLKRLGIAEVVMISGDNPRTAELIARELGIDRVFAEVLPQDKLRIVGELQAEGRKVAFVGDGVNDAPALAQADVGIAMGLNGTDVALETADIGLMADEIERIPQLVELSRRSLRTINQNVVFSMSVNLLSVLLGGFGIIGPVVGALMHEFSALPVLANSARLIGVKAAG